MKKVISFRVSDNEKKEIFEKAINANMTESEYIRNCIFNQKETDIAERIKDFNCSNKQETIHIRINKQEKISIEEKATNANMSVSSYILHCCHNTTIKIIEFKELAKELNYVGKNLNQLVMLCHQGLIAAPDLNELNEELKKCYQQLNKMR